MRFLWLPVLVLGLSACASTPRYEPAELKKIAQTELRIERQWKKDIGKVGDRPSLRPLSAAGRVFAASADGKVMALDPSGNPLWSVDTARSLMSGPALVDGRLVVGSRDGELIALSALDGELQWENQLSSALATLPAGDAGLLVVKSEDGRVQALDPQSGDLRWTVPLNVPPLTWRGNAPLQLTEEAVLVGTSTGRLQALSRGDGSLIWEQTVAEPRGRSEIERLVDVDADLLLVNPVIIAVSTGGNVRVLRQDNGQVIWERSVGGFVGAALDETCLYLVDRDDVVSCLDPRNGAAIWTNENLRYRRLSGAYAYKGNVLLADYDGYVHALSTASGQIIARERLSSAAIPWLGEGPEGRVLALAANGHLNVFDTQPLSAR